MVVAWSPDCRGVAVAPTIRRLQLLLPAAAARPRPNQRPFRSIYLNFKTLLELLASMSCITWRPWLEVVAAWAGSGRGGAGGRCCSGRRVTAGRPVLVRAHTAQVHSAVTAGSARATPG